MAALITIGVKHISFLFLPLRQLGRGTRLSQADFGSEVIKQSLTTFLAVEAACAISISWGVPETAQPI